MPTLDFWFEFASTYSYPAAMRITGRAEAEGVDVRWRPFLLGAVFKQQGLPLDSPFNSQPAKGHYMWRDLERICANLDLPFRRPDPFPQPSILAARIALIGMQNDWGQDFARAIYRAEFGRGLNIGSRGAIALVLNDIGVDAEPVLAIAGTDAIKNLLRSETEEAMRLGIFGAPSFVTADGELFWGNDRLDQALEWAAERSP
jgi:2-hydroxychromene-2-carboxylate isomerase